MNSKTKNNITIAILIVIIVSSIITTSALYKTWRQSGNIATEAQRLNNALIDNG